MNSSTSSSSSSSDDDAHAVAAVLLCAASTIPTTRRIGGSRPGRRSNRDIQRIEGSNRIDKDYFCRFHPEPPIFLTQEFERRFTITRSIYETVRATICDYDSFFVQRKDCCGQLGASSDQKICAALRVLSSGAAPDAFVDYFRLAEPTILLFLKSFCQAVIACFKDKYLRRPTISDIYDIEAQYAHLGFPCCLGCVDCSGWEWDNCPVAYHGQYTGKSGKPTIRMEVVCDDRLWVWHLVFGVPGAKNEKSILNQSTLFNDIRAGNWPPSRPKVNIAGTIINWYYYLSDGIYPRFRIFAKPHPNPKTTKQKCYTAAHSSGRKAVERVFGVLDGQFEILHTPARLADINDISDIAHTCIILHNMIVEQRGYDGTTKFRIGEDMRQTTPTSFHSVEQRAFCTYHQAELWRKLLDPIESLDDHIKLQDALMNSVWNTHGDSQD